MILITGGTGLVGSHLLFRLVSSGKKLRAIYRSKSSFGGVKKVFSYYSSEAEANRLFDQIEWKKADVTDIPALEKALSEVEFVYHCAAVVSFDSSKDSLLRKVNIEGTANVVNLCVAHKIKKLCHVSSIATFDQKSGEKVISEASLWNKEKDHSMYAITKYGAEMEVWRGSQEGLDVVIINPGIIIGPGFWDSGSGKIFSQINSGLKYYFPKVTGFVGVADVVEILILLMDSAVKNEKFIAVSENLSFREVFKITAEALNKPTPSKMLKPWMISAGWLLERFGSLFSGKERLLSRKSSETLFEETYYSSGKLQQRFGFEFQPVEEVIGETATFFKRDF